jgi:hypothetical protein
VTERPDAEHEELGAEDPAVVRRLEADRPVPAPAFRGALGRYLMRRDPGYGPRPARLRVISLAYLTAGVLLMVLGLLQATGGL